MPSTSITNDKHEVMCQDYFLYSPYYDPWFCIRYMLCHIIKEIISNYMLIVIFQRGKSSLIEKPAPVFTGKHL